MADISIFTLPDNTQYNIKDSVARSALEQKITMPSGGSVGNVLKKTSNGTAWSEENNQWSSIEGKPTFASVATTGVYSDLIGTPTIPDELSDLSDDSSHRLVTDTEKTTWNGKANSDHTHDDRYYTETEVDQALALKQNTLTFDSTPTANSSNPVTSAGIKSSIDNVVAVATGKTKSFVFDTVAQLETWLTNSTNTSGLNTGDVFLIRAVNVPDYWWDGSSKQQLETTKVDLTDYATTSSLSTGLAGKSDTNHTHDDRYYTETEVDTLLNAKANTASLATVATSGLYSSLGGTPSSLPANGGNADTVDGYHLWMGSSSQLPASRDSNTIYIVV